jgi:hypothetical protein
MRLRRAAWQGLGLLWCADKELDKGPWSVEQELPPAQFNELDGLEAALQAEVKRTESSRHPWGKAVQVSRPSGVKNSSRIAQGLIEPVITRLLGDAWSWRRGEDQKFQTFRRTGATDGVWSRMTGSPATIALEVKVDEDGIVPFGQVIDDLGTFDAAVQVRLLMSEKTASDLRRAPNGNTDARQRFIKRMKSALPVKMIEICFCSKCRAYMPDGTKHEPLACENCRAH